jgi:hypothetical protein
MAAAAAAAAQSAAGKAPRRALQGMGASPARVVRCAAHARLALGEPRNSLSCFTKTGVLELFHVKSQTVHVGWQSLFWPAPGWES